jgi:hypothetical protein
MHPLQHIKSPIRPIEEEIGNISIEDGANITLDSTYKVWSPEGYSITPPKVSQETNKLQNSTIQRENVHAPPKIIQQPAKSPQISKEKDQIRAALFGDLVIQTNNNETSELVPISSSVNSKEPKKVQVIENLLDLNEEMPEDNTQVNIHTLKYSFYMIPCQILNPSPFDLQLSNYCRLINAEGNFEYNNLTKTPLLMKEVLTSSTFISCNNILG